MTVSLTPELESLVTERVESGLYHSAGEVLREALHLLKERDDFQQTRLENLRADIAVGMEQAERGQTQPFDAAALKRRVHERLAADTGS